MVVRSRMQLRPAGCAWGLAPAGLLTVVHVAHGGVQAGREALCWASYDIAAEAQLVSVSKRAAVLHVLLYWICK